MATYLGFVCFQRLLHLVVILDVVAGALANVLVGLVGNGNLLVALVLYVDDRLVVAGVAAQAVPSSCVGVGDDGGVDVIGCGLHGGLEHGGLGFDGGARSGGGGGGRLIRLRAVAGFVFIVVVLLRLLETQRNG